MKPDQGQVDIYLSLDELLDTRAGTLDRMDPAIAEKVIDDKYHTRTSDFFAGIDRHDFKKLYAARDGDTLSHSCMTEMYRLLQHLSESVVNQLDQRPYYKSCKIVVNCWPYQIAPDVLEDIHKAIYLNVGNNLPIELVNWPLSELTPSRCKKEFGVLIMYNPQDWLNMHMKELERAPIPEVLLLTPKIHHVVEPTPEQEAWLKEYGLTPFLAAEMQLRPLISVDLIEVAYFSLVKV